MPNNLISMYAPAAFFGTDDISGFISVFTIYEGNREAQVTTLQQLIASEPDSPSGKAAANWFVLQQAA